MEAIAAKLIELFRGRHDMLAWHNGQHFEPKKLTKPLQPSFVAREHLGGNHCLGFYLLTQESKVYASCVDFDNKPTDPDPAWQSKTEALYYYLCQAGMSPLVERSQSGNGAHVWLFFHQPIDAWVIRAFWGRVANRLNQTFREIYPRQDQLKGKGLGNLVRFPLWNQSAFVDVESEWSEIEPLQALSDARTMVPADLTLICFQLGLGELKRETKQDTASGLPTRVAQLVSHSESLIGKRWRGNPAGMGDTSKSSIAQSLCCELVRLYVPTPEVEAALRRWCQEHGYEKGDRDDWISATVAKAYDYVIRRTETKSTTSITLQDAALAYVDQLAAGGTKYYPFGVKPLDRSIDGTAAGEYAVVGGRPGHGKSAITFVCLDENSKEVPCLLLSEEMTPSEVAKRRLMALSTVEESAWQYEIEGLRKLARETYDQRHPIHIVEGCSTIERAEDVINQFASLHGVKLVVIDYLQSLRGNGNTDTERIADVSKRLKALAKNERIAMVVIAHSKRDQERGTGYRSPRLDDIYGSDQIAKDADLLFFTEFCSRTGPPPKGAKEEEKKAWKDLFRFWIAKRRNGPIRQPVVEMRFNAAKQTFFEPPTVKRRTKDSK